MLLLSALLFPTLVLAQKPAQSSVSLPTSSRYSESIKDEFIEVSDEPKPLEKIMVKYPPEAREKGIEGKVTFSALIDTEGRVVKVEIVRTNNDIFCQPVIDAVKKTKFSPALNNTKPVKVWFTDTVAFRIRSDEAEPDPNSH